MSDPSKKPCNKIRDIVRLQQMLKKWKKLANTTTATTAATATAATATKSIKFLKKTLSFSELTLATNSSSSSSSPVPKGFVAVCVGEEMKRFVVPTEYLSRPAFGVLLREAEEEFGFQKEGVLRFPCEVGEFERILEAMGEEKGGSPSTSPVVEARGGVVERLSSVDIHDLISSYDAASYDQLCQHHPQMCRSR